MAKSKSNYIEGIDRLFESSRSRIYPKNQLIHYQGDPLTHIYLIKSGFVKSYTILESGDTRTILLLSAGDIFPLAFSTTLDWDDYIIHNFYQSLTDVELAVLPNEILRQHIQNDPTLMNVYMAYLAASNEVITQQLEVMKNKKAIDKLALFLPYLISKAGKQIRPNVYELQLKLSHQEIADLSGVTRETATTLIKQLEKSGILDQQRSRWRVNTTKLDKFLPG